MKNNNFVKNKDLPFVFPYNCNITKIETALNDDLTFNKTHSNFLITGNIDLKEKTVFFNIKMNAFARISLNWLAELIKKSLDEKEIEQLKNMI